MGLNALYGSARFSDQGTTSPAGSAFPITGGTGGNPVGLNWIPNFYFATDDIEASSAKVRDLGGAAESKAPVPGHGWFAPCVDTEGNAFSLWQADDSASMPE